MEPEQISENYFYKKKVTIYQGRKGYRFSVDSPILADFLPALPGEKALEIGTGSGVISLLSLYQNKFKAIVGLEIQDRLARLASRNSEKNGFYSRFTIIKGDFNCLYRDFTGIGHIFSNPPYSKLGMGRLSPNVEIRDAKFETRLILGDLVKKSKDILGDRGNIYMVLPYHRYDELLALASGIHLQVARSRLVFPFKDGKADRFLIQLCNYDVSPVQMEPLVIFEGPGKYTDEMENIFAGR